jgi:hypothetical protein
MGTSRCIQSQKSAISTTGKSAAIKPVRFALSIPDPAVQFLISSQKCELKIIILP